MLIELVAIALASALPLPQPAPDTNRQHKVISTVWATPDKCNYELAIRMEFAALAKEPRRWDGKCVAVEGYWWHKAFFASKGDAQDGYDPSFKGKDRRIGIYGDEQLRASAPKTPSAFTAVGLVGQCEDLGRGAVFVSGYCHYFEGPYIAVAEMRRR